MMLTLMCSQPTEDSREEQAKRRPLSIVEVPAEEWRVMLAMRPNVLIEGPNATTEAILRQLWTQCGEAVPWRSDGLPGRTARTLIVREAAALSADDQHRLLRWLDLRGLQTQVISTTVQPLFPLVQHGLFLENLYYRLNVMRLDMWPVDLQ